MKDSSGLGFQRVSRLLWLWLFLLWTWGGGPLWAEEALRIKAIRVEGNQRVDDSIVRGSLESRPGESYLPGKLGKDIQRIDQLGHFDDVQVDLQKHPDGVVLTYWVKERPTLEVLAIEGNQEIPTREIEARLGLRLHSVFDRQALWQGVERVRELYRERGYHFVVVEPRVAFLLGNQADLRLTIGEGKRARIRHIRFTGNRSFKEEELKAVMESKEQGALYSLLSQDVYLEPRLKTDLIRLGDLYADRGFFTSRVGEPRIEMDEERGEVSIDIPIEEGEPFRVRRLVVAGDRLYPEEELKRGMATRDGALLSRAALKNDAAYLADLYSQKGYALCQVEPQVRLDRERKLAGVEFAIERGPQLHIGKVQVLGNRQVKEEVIRRELSFKEGDLFDSRALALTRKQLEKSGYFEGVEIEAHPQAGREDALELRVKVAEKSAAEVELGGGYSTASSLLALAELEEVNLFGSGLRLKMDGELGGRDSRFALELSQPYFLDRPLWATLSLYGKQKRHPFFDTDRLGGQLSLEQSLFESVRGELALKYEVIDLQEGEKRSFSRLSGEKGSERVGSIKASFSRDTLDAPLFPSRGSRGLFYWEMAGLLGDVSFIKGELDWRTYIPLRPFTRPGRGDWTLKLHGNMGWGAALDGGKLPLFERFFLGGDAFLRGYGYEEVGPRRRDGGAMGGHSRTLLSAELLFPLSLPFPFADHIRGVSFLDMGDVFDDQAGGKMLNPFSYKKSAGFGVRVQTPWGLLRLDWAYQIDPGEEGRRGDPYKIHFGFGTSF